MNKHLQDTEEPRVQGKQVSFAVPTQQAGGTTIVNRDTDSFKTTLEIVSKLSERITLLENRVERNEKRIHSVESRCSSYETFFDSIHGKLSIQEQRQVEFIKALETVQSKSSYGQFKTAQAVNAALIPEPSKKPESVLHNLLSTTTSAVVENPKSDKESDIEAIKNLHADLTKGAKDEDLIGLTARLRRILEKHGIHKPLSMLTNTSLTNPLTRHSMCTILMRLSADSAAGKVVSLEK